MSVETVKVLVYGKYSMNASYYRDLHCVVMVFMEARVSSKRCYWNWNMGWGWEGRPGYFQVPTAALPSLLCESTEVPRHLREMDRPSYLS